MVWSPSPQRQTPGPWPTHRSSLRRGSGTTRRAGAGTLDGGQPGLRFRSPREVDRERLGADAGDGPAVAERRPELVLGDSARARVAWLPVAEAQQVAGRPGPRHRG